MIDLSEKTIFDQGISDQIKDQILDILPKTLGSILPDTIIQRVSIKIYPGGTTICKRRVQPGAAYALACFCEHSTEHIYLTHDQEAGWLAQRAILKERSLPRRAG